MNIDNIQQALQAEGIDCWLIYDFQGTNPIMAQLLRQTIFVTRRAFIIIPASGEPKLLGSRIDHDTLQALPFEQTYYVSWREMQDRLRHFLADYQTIGMDYSPNGMLPTVSRVDGGTLDIIRGMGKTVVSAGNVFQAGAAVWGESVLEAHLEDAAHVAAIKDEAFQFIAGQLRNNRSLTDYDVQTFIMQRFEAASFITQHPPIVAINADSSDPHYFPSAEKNAPIKKGDWILIDLWAKRPGYEHVFADMTWVGRAGSTPSPKQQEIFEVVAAARDKVVAFVDEAARQNQTVEGWQVDDVARESITEAGYGEYFFHRTGHSLGPGDHVHGPGVNLDNLETHDTRKLMPGIGFTVEPGVYLPEFGVRLEINVYMDQTGPRVTTPIQDAIICLDV